MRLAQFCVRNKITPSGGISMLTKLWPTTSHVGLHSKLSDKDIEGLIEIMRNRHVPKVEARKVNLPSEDYVSFSMVEKPSKMENEIINFLIGHGSKKQRNPHLVKDDNRTIETIFQNFEAYALCYGVDNPSARGLYERYVTGKNSARDDYEAQSFAMKVYKQYGSSFLEFLIDLPPLPVQSDEPREVFKLMDLRAQYHKNPTLRFIQDGSQFIVEFVKIEDKFNSQVLKIRNETSSSEFYFQRDGKVKAVSNPLKINDLRIFLYFNKHANRMLLAFGAETGHCAVCGRELTTLESIRRGMGPVCARSIGAI